MQSVFVLHAFVAVWFLLILVLPSLIAILAVIYLTAYSARYDSPRIATKNRFHFRLVATNNFLACALFLKGGTWTSLLTSAAVGFWSSHYSRLCDVAAATLSLWYVHATSHASPELLLAGWMAGFLADWHVIVKLTQSCRSTCYEHITRLVIMHIFSAVLCIGTGLQSSSLSHLTHPHLWPSWLAIDGDHNEMRWGYVRPPSRPSMPLSVFSNTVNIVFKQRWKTTCDDDICQSLKLFYMTLLLRSLMISVVFLLHFFCGIGAYDQVAGPYRLGFHMRAT